MAQTTRIFRIFVSSTFTDHQEERNALQREVSEERKALEQEVFPALKKLCTERGCQFWFTLEGVCLQKFLHVRRLGDIPVLIQRILTHIHPKGLNAHRKLIDQL